VLSSAMLLLVLVLPATVGASVSSPGTGSGLKISPVVTNLTINAGDTQTVQLFIQNVSSSSVALQALVNDFTSNNETGEPALLLNNAYAPSHSLKRFIVPISNFELPGKSEKVVNVQITVPKGTPGGGYYGAIRFLPAEQAAGGNVTLTASVGSLILVKVPGYYKEQMKLASLDVLKNVNSDPSVLFTNNKGLVASIRIQNLGDIQEQPFGKLLLKQGDKILAAYEINNTQPRGNVIPDSVRRFTVGLDKVGSIGKYTLVGNFGYGTNGQLISGETTFYVVPIPLILTIAVVILLLAFLVFVLPRIMKAYNRRILQRAAKGK